MKVYTSLSVSNKNIKKKISIFFGKFIEKM